MANIQQKQDSDCAEHRWFASTHWSVVLSAADGAAPGAQEALEKLCRTYWYPLYAYVRRQGHNVEEAQDFTQDFLARLLSKNYLALANPVRGRFRTFLLTSLQNFLVNEWKREATQRRGGGQRCLSLDQILDTESGEDRYRLDPASDLTPEKLFERRWALTLLDQALERVQREYTAAGNAALFEHLKPFLADRAAMSDHSAGAAQLGMTVGAVAVALNRLRKRYRQAVRDEIANTVSSPEEIDAEMRHLFEVLTG